MAKLKIKETLCPFVVGVVLAVNLISLANPGGAQILDVDVVETAELTSYGGYPQIYSYQYTLTFAPNNTKELSHWSLELSVCCDEVDLIDPSAFPGSWSYDKPRFKESILGYKICGIKWDAGDSYKSGAFTFAFYSLGKPTIVNWYAKSDNLTDGGTTIGPNCDNPIAVELTSFTAQATAGTVTLTWTTATETENLGFHIYRRLKEKAEYVQINSKLIPGAGTSVQPHNYSYVDRTAEPDNTYYYKLAEVDFNGTTKLHGPIPVTVEALPTEYALEQNYPNPFNPETAINFALKEAGKVTLKIYNVQGQLVRTLMDEEKPAGIHSVMWNATNEQERKVASGVYFYTLKVNGFEATKKLMFMK